MESIGKYTSKQLPAAAARLLFVVAAWLGLAAGAHAQTAITVSPLSLPYAAVGVPYEATVTASGGSAPYTFTVGSGEMPPGLTLETDGDIVGEPTNAGNYNVTIVATDATEATGSRFYPMEVGVVLSIDPGFLPNAKEDEDYSVQLSVAGGDGFYLFSIEDGSLPPGLELSQQGLISGTPFADGEYDFVVVAEPLIVVEGSTAGFAPAVPPGGAYAEYSLEVEPAITLTPSSLPSATVHEPYNVDFDAQGATPPLYFYYDGTLPPGLELDEDTGTLGGTPTEDGVFEFFIGVMDATEDGDSGTYTIEVELPTIVLAPADLPDGTVGEAYDETVSASGGLAPYSFALVGELPQGLELDPDSGALAGTPTEAGSFSFTIVAEDADGHDGSRAYAVDIAAPTIVLAPPTLPDGVVGEAYDQVVSASGGVAPYSFELAGELPQGIELDPDSGALAGTPTEDGSFSFTITAEDADGYEGSQAYAIDIAAPTLVLSPPTLPDGTVGTAYAQDIVASGGAAPYNIHLVSGTLPPGLSLAMTGDDTARLEGTPTSDGEYAFVVGAMDANGFTVTRDYVVGVLEDAPVAVDDEASTESHASVDIAVTANDSGNISAIAIVGAPSHGSASVDGLSVTYTPTDDYFGDDSFSYTASGPGGVSGAATVTVHVAPLPVPVGVPQSLEVLAGDSVAFDAAEGASGGPITGVTIVQPPALGTASVSGTQVTYTAPADGFGTQQVGYVLSNAYGDSEPVVSTIAIDARPVAPELHASTPMGISVELDLTSGASGGPFVDAAIQEVLPSGAGTAMLLDDGDGSFRLRFTPDDAFTGEASVAFTLSNAHATSEPGSAIITVTERDDPTRDPQVGGIVQAQVFTVREFVQAQINNVQQRLEELHEPGQRKWGFWIGGTLRHGDRGGNGAVAPASFETSGLTSGADYRFSERFAFGGALGHGRDRTAIGDEGSRSDGRAESAIGYGSFKPPSMPFYLDGLAGHQRITFQLQRVDPATGEVMSVPRDGVQSFTSWASGYEHKTDTWMFGSYGRMDVSQARLDAYEEQGSPLQALAFEEMAIQTRVSTLGVRGRFKRQVRWGTLEPKFRIEFQRDFHDASGAVIRYADQDEGPAYVLPGDGLDRSRAIVEVGGVLRTFGGMILRLELRSIRGGPNDSDNAITFSLQDDH